MASSQNIIFRISYCWLWTLFLGITTAWVWVYLQATGIAIEAISAIPVFADIQKIKEATVIGAIAQWLTGVLVWWRIVKVFVLMGSPFPFGMRIYGGRQDNGQGGRIVAAAYIGDHEVYGNDYTGKFFYGAVFRAHPRSDKLMRSRLELLVLALPFGGTIIIEESRLYFARKNHQERGKVFRRVMSAYSKQAEQMPPHRFRREVIGKLDSINKAIRKAAGN